MEKLKKLKDLTGILERELLYNLVSGLKFVKNNLKKYPEDIQLKEATFSSSTKKVNESNGKVSIVVGLEGSKTKEFSEASNVTYAYEKMRFIRSLPNKFDWDKTGIHLQHEFAGYILREIADEIIVSAQTGVPIKNITIEKSYSITKSINGTLQLKFLKDKLELSANRKWAKTVTNNFKIIFEPPAKEDKKEGKPPIV